MIWNRILLISISIDNCLSIWVIECVGGYINSCGIIDYNLVSIMGMIISFSFICSFWVNWYS